MSAKKLPCITCRENEAIDEPTLADVLAEMRALRAETSRTVALLAGLVAKKETRKQQAKRLGCSVRTLRNRETRAEHKMILKGII